MSSVAVSPKPLRQRERPAVGDKWRRFVKEPFSADRCVVEPASLPSASRSASREDLSLHRRRREAGHPSGQRRASATAEADLASTI